MPAGAKGIDDLLATVRPEPVLELIAKAVPQTTGTPESTSRFTCIEDLPRVEDVGASEIIWDVQGLLPSGTLLLLTGESGAGKSTFACALAYAVSRGQEFLGRQTTKRPVLILDAENPSVAVIERLRRLGITTDNDFRVWGQWTGEDPPAAGGAIVLDWVTRCDPKPLIIVDSLVRFYSGDENDAAEMRSHMAQYRKLAAAGVTIIILHHTGKSEASQDYRGSSDIKASIDIGYKLTPVGDGSQLDIMELRAFKQRISVEPSLHLQYRNGKFVTNTGEVAKTVAEQLVDLLKGNPGISATEFRKLASAKGLGRNVGATFLSNGFHNGTIRRESAGRAKRHYWMGFGDDSAPFLEAA